MKILKLIFLGSILSVVIACNNDSTITNMDLLVNEVWVNDFSENLYYHNQSLDSTILSYENAQIEKVKFENEGEVLYENSNFPDTFYYGTWHFENNTNEVILSDVNYLPPPGTGWPAYYFFPKDSIVELTESSLVLQEKNSRLSYIVQNDTFKIVTIHYYKR